MLVVLRALRRALPVAAGGRRVRPGRRAHGMGDVGRDAELRRRRLGPGRVPRVLRRSPRRRVPRQPRERRPLLPGRAPTTILCIDHDTIYRP